MEKVLLAYTVNVELVWVGRGFRVYNPNIKLHVCEYPAE